jgi:hypothetical protein
MPPKPYLVGEEASFMPFQKYLEKVLSIAKVRILSVLDIRT